MKARYFVTVGETGNEVGHTSQHDCGTDADEIRAAKRMAAPYGRDGWWMVSDDTGRPVAHGGKR